jgi:cytoskeletal protein RodZ
MPCLTNLFELLNRKKSHCGLFSPGMLMILVLTNFLCYMLIWFLAFRWQTANFKVLAML